MKKAKGIKQTLAYFLCAMLIVAMALIANGCEGREKENHGQEVPDVSNEEHIVVGEGNTVFDFSVVDPQGNIAVYEIHTNQTTVGAALMELELISGEEGPYGLYVKEVDSIVLDYDKDGYYWSFYVNEEYAMSGVDQTAITPGTTYSFKAEKS